MKRFVLALALVAAAIPSYAARQSVTQITGTQASIGALKTQVNTRLDAADDNFIELYSAYAGKADVSCFATAAAFDACFDLSWQNPAFTSVHATGGNIAASNMQVTKAWQTGLPYTADVTSVIHGGKHYICTSTHTAGASTEPGVGASWATSWKVDSGGGVESYSDVVSVFGSGSCSGYLKSDGTCSTPSVGTADSLTAQYIDWSASSGGASIANKPTLGTAAALNVGTGANNIVQLNSSGQLPFTIDVSDLTDTDGLFTAKANSSCFASESAFNACFPLNWPTGGGAWGSITGTLSDQADLQAALDAISGGSLPFVSDTTPPAVADRANYSTSDKKIRFRHSNGDVYATVAATLETAADTTPETITFTDVTNAAVSTTYTDCKQVTGINWPAAVSASGGTAAVCTSATYATDCGTFGTSPGNVPNNGWVCARTDSSGSAGTAVNNVVTVGGGGDTFTVTTAAGDVTLAEQTVSTESRDVTTSSYVGQSFVPSQTKNLKNFQLYMTTGGSNITYTCRIGTTVNLNTTYLEQFTLTETTSNNSWAIISSSTNPSLSSGTTYYVHCRTDKTSGPQVGINTSDNYANGIRYYGADWTMSSGSSATSDLRFRVEGQ